MARLAETYRGARRNAEFGREPSGNVWPRGHRWPHYRREGIGASTTDRPAKQRRQSRRFKDLVGPSPSALKKAEQRKAKYLHSSVRRFGPLAWPVS